MKVKELTGWLDGRYPSSAAEHWDNVGLLVGDDEEEVSHVFLALDLTESTLAQAIDAGSFSADFFFHQSVSSRRIT